MSRLRVLIVGSGGREHALGWALAAGDPSIEIHAAPGNPGLVELGRTWPVAADDLDGLSRLVREERYGLVVVGPEEPLARGLADRLRAQGTAVFGPGAEAAVLEASKAFAKSFMERHGIPTAEFAAVRDLAGAERLIREWGAPLVVKASGLAAGKGVTVAASEEEAIQAARECLRNRAFGDAGAIVVLERRLTGPEASVFVITDGRDYRLLPASQDHKRAYDGDTGPNTGGMGAYSPAPVLSAAVMAAVRKRVIEPTLEGLRAEARPYRGLLYVGLMLTEDGPRVLEYNVRFGDPETQAVLPRLGYDLGGVLLAAARGELGRVELPEPAHAAGACVVAAAGDYPRGGSRGEPITGIEAARERGALVFHAGTALAGGAPATAGGRILAVAGTGATLSEALATAYAGVGEIHFEGMRYRSDIGRGAAGSGPADGDGAPAHSCDT